MTPALNRRCTACGQALAASDVAASVENRLARRWWCMSCWDDPNELALRQYQAAQVVSVLFCELFVDPARPMFELSPEVQLELQHHPGWYRESELIGGVLRYRWWVPAPIHREDSE